MKSLKESIFNDVEDMVNNDTILIEQFLKDNYIINGSYTAKNGVVDVNGNVDVKNLKLKTLTDGLFRFGKVSGSFDCSDCCNLISLEGAPKEVGRRFYCTNCSKLTSLEGAPEEVNKTFDCGDCKNITSLKGAPKEVGENFYCTYCKSLTSLEGAPERLRGILRCGHCENLKITDQDRKKYKISC